MLTNAEMDSVSLFAAILCGQSQVRCRLRFGSFAALDQRVALRYEVLGMDAKEAADHLKHHRAPAGRNDTLFSDDAVALLRQARRGATGAARKPGDPGARGLLRREAVGRRRVLDEARSDRGHGAVNVSACPFMPGQGDAGVPSGGVALQPPSRGRGIAPPTPSSRRDGPPAR